MALQGGGGPPMAGPMAGPEQGMPGPPGGGPMGGGGGMPPIIEVGKQMLDLFDADPSEENVAALQTILMKAVERLQGGEQGPAQPGMGGPEMAGAGAPAGPPAAGLM